MVARNEPRPIGIRPFVDLDLHALPSVNDRRASGHHRVDLGQLRRRTVAGLLILGPPHLFAELRHDEPPRELAKVDGERLPRAPRYRDLRATLGKRPRRGLPVVNTHRSAPPRFGDAQFAAHPVAAVGQPSLDRSGRTAMAGGYLGDAHSVQIERPQRPPLLLRHRLQGVDHGLRRPAPARIRHPHAVHGRELLGPDDPLPPLRGTQVVAAAVPRNLVEPRAQVPGLLSAQPRPRPHERLLQHVLDRVARPQTIADQRTQRPS